MGQVYIGRVVAVNPIALADRLEIATVVCGSGGKWNGCIVKGTMAAGDFCQVYLQDSILPQTPEFAFMEKHGYRVKMARFRGAPSECLIMPQVIDGQVGDDVTVAAGVTKYEKPLPASIGGEIAGHFPQFIPKTDELNFQAAPELVAALRGIPYYTTVKYDGTSTTCYRKGDHFGVCSRNYELKETEGNVMWQIANRYNLPANLPDGVALQWETIGPSIQGNPVGLKQADMRLFSVYGIPEGRYADWTHANMIAHLLGVPFVEQVECPQPFDLDDDGLRALAEGLYPNGHQREGIVIRPLEEQKVITKDRPTRLSFKVVSLAYGD